MTPNSQVNPHAKGPAQATDTFVIRPVQPGDIQPLVPLNNALAPHVSVVDAAAMADLVSWAEVAIVAVDSENGALAGAMVALPPGTPYDSPNYSWFCERYDDFLYVDRVMVAPEYHKRGLGRRLYQPVIAQAATRGAPVTCEVNEVPPNPNSYAFHSHIGFAKVGTKEYGGGSKRVAMMAMPTRKD